MAGKFGASVGILDSRTGTISVVAPRWEPNTAPWSIGSLKFRATSTTIDVGMVPPEADCLGTATRSTTGQMYTAKPGTRELVLTTNRWQGFQQISTRTSARVDGPAPNSWSMSGRLVITEVGSVSTGVANNVTWFGLAPR